MIQKRDVSTVETPYDDIDSVLLNKSMRPSRIAKQEYLTQSTPKQKEDDSSDTGTIFNRNPTVDGQSANVRIRTSKEVKFSKFVRQKIEQQEPKEVIMQRINSFGSEVGTNSQVTPLEPNRMRNSFNLEKLNQEIIHEEDASKTKNEDLLENIIFESKEIDFDQLRRHPNYTEKRYKDAIYLGTMRNDMRDGKGIMKYANGRQYEGEWIQDNREGKGFERYPNRNTYFGQFKYGRAHGKGVYTWHNGEVYDGQWDQGLKQGYGVWKGVKNDSYIGEWQNSKAHGYGVHQWPNGDRYEGQWKESLKHGQGADTFANGESYHGEFHDGKANGKGEYKWPGGQIYVGDFKNGLKHGYGKWKSSQT